MYEKELNSIKKSNRFRERKLFDENLIDLASNDYLGLANNKELLQKAFLRIEKLQSFSPKASILVNGYSKIHKEFEELLSKVNGFEDGTEITPDFLLEEGIIRSVKDGVKILGNGDLDKRLFIQTHKISKQAEEKILAQGGKVEVI